MLQQIIESAYLAHGYCLVWNPWLVSLHAASDLLIFAAYFAIPVAIFIFLRKRRDLEMKRLALLFAAFIFLCGLTHLFQLVTLWHPLYELQGVVKAMTAAVSVATAIAIYPLLPRALAIPSPRALERSNMLLREEISSHNSTLARLSQARAELEQRVEERTRELQRTRERFEALVEASANAVWTTTPDGKIAEDSASWREFTGQTLEQFRGAGWLDAVHPDDRTATVLRWQEAVRSGEMYEIDYRLRHATGGWRWTAAKAVPLREPDGSIREWIGMNEDITERKSREEHIKLVMRELSHRTKNLLAVISSIARRTFHVDRPVAENIAVFTERLHGLSRSHDLLVRGDWEGAGLAELVASHLSAFTDLDRENAPSISGPQVLLTPQAAQNVGLALHELATNSAKYGAMRRGDCVLHVSWSTEQGAKGPDLVLTWREQAPGIQSGTLRSGFGRMLLEMVVPSALEGTADYRVDETGVFWQMRASLAQLTADAEGRQAA